MEDSFIECPVCGRNTCYKQIIDSEGNFSLLCLSCGMTTNTYYTVDSELDKKTYEASPELYKDLRFVDQAGLVWYPSTITVPNKGMVFVDGSSKDNWKWATALAVEIPEKELKKFPKGQTHKMDMSTLVHFKQDEFTLALERINFFSLA
jgi:hypothetical protein